MLARIGDFAHVFEDLFGFVRILCNQRGKADNRVHRGADIVRHVRKEVALRAVCRLGHAQSLLEFDVHALLFGSVGKHHDEAVLAVEYRAVKHQLEPVLVAGGIIPQLQLRLPGAALL